MSHEHKSGLSGAYDRARAHPEWDEVITREQHVAQAAELVEAQTILRRKIRAIGDLTARDGDRIEGGEIMIDADAGTVTLTAGRVYVAGRVLPVAGVTLSGVPMIGAVTVGVRLVETWITEEDDPSLMGLHPGSDAEGEAGAARGIVSLDWGFADDGKPGDLYSVYLLKDGVAIDQSPPPNLSGINAQIAIYDYDANGNYVVSGCKVTALGKDAGDQVFSISAGTANINGFKRVRHAAIRHREPEASDQMRIPTEVHTFGSNPTTITLNHGPIATINQVMVEKEITETVTRGGTPNGKDNLANTGVLSIVEVKAGGTTYVEGTSFVRTGDTVDWSPGGPEPTSGTSYTVKYRFLGVVAPSVVTATAITVAGGVNGGQVHVDYDFHLPRVDILGLDEDGLPIYIKGISNRANPLPPQVPSDVLPLAMIDNKWGGKPDIAWVGIPAMTMEDNYKLKMRLIDTLNLVALERLQRDIDSREPVAKAGLFVDPFTSDRYRDAGAPQTAAVFDGLIRLPITVTHHALNQPGVTLLDWTERVAVEQPLATSCRLINPYMNFEPMPGQMSLTPAFDFWTETATEWTSDSTQAIAVPVTTSTRGNTITTTRQVEDTRVVDEREELLDFLRQINVAFEIKGFFAGEILDELTFDGIDITPTPKLAADGTGKITGTFTIPADVPAGSKAVVATGQGGSEAASVFVGQGVIDITTMRRTITTTVSEQVIQQAKRKERPPGGWADPLAQTFTLLQGRHLAGVDIKICAIGNPENAIVLEIVTVENGIPTADIVAQAYYDMHAAVIGDWTAIRFAYPIWLSGGVEYAFVVKTDDSQHSIHTAKLGDFDAVNQRPVASQPYSIGTMLSSANARTWTPHQEEDITFRLIEAHFAPVTKTVPLGTFNAGAMSDLLIMAEVELPTAAASLHFEVELLDGSVTLLRPGQAWERQDHYNGQVKVRAVLSGSATVSPVLFPVILAVAGKLEATGTYISRAFDIGTAVDLIAWLKTYIPTGSSIALAVDNGAGSFSSVAQTAQSPLQDPGWVERRYAKSGHTANPTGRVRLMLSGTPAARPMAYDFRVISAP
ncbi:DUF4815 domain-containing protein [Aquamicrobium terrae]